MEITFYGVRGSCPCPDDSTLRYGGNTACVALTVEGEAPILFDLGTGLRCFGASQPLDGSFRATALVTHTHWDHVQGLPFFAPADRVGAELDVYGPAQETGSLCEVFDGFIRPPLFPIRYADLRGQFRFHDVIDEDLSIGNATVRVRPVPHIGPTVGYQVRWDGTSVAYISDHQAPLDLVGVADSVMDLLDGTDVLIHDAQYTPDEFAEKAHWGHCTIDYAVHLAQLAGIPTVVLFHHDPAHNDDEMDRLVAEAQATAGADGPTVVAAYEGLRLRF